MITNDELNWLEELEKKLHDKEWKPVGNNVIQTGNEGIVAECGGKPFWSDFPEVAEFIAAARNALPALLAEIRELRAFKANASKGYHSCG